MAIGWFATLCLSVLRCACLTGHPAASMIGRAILIAAVVIAVRRRPGMSRRAGGRQAAGTTMGVAQLGDLVAQLAPALERVGDVGVERHRADLVVLVVHARVHRAALVVRGLPRTGRRAGARGTAERLIQCEVSRGGCGEYRARGARVSRARAAVSTLSQGARSRPCLAGAVSFTIGISATLNRARSAERRARFGRRCFGRLVLLVESVGLARARGGC
jgi:hypothetical protein